MRNYLSYTVSKSNSEINIANRYIGKIGKSAKKLWKVIEQLQQDIIKINIYICDRWSEKIEDQFLIQIHQRFPQRTTIMLIGQAEKDAMIIFKQQFKIYSCLAQTLTKKNFLKLSLPR